MTAGADPRWGSPLAPPPYVGRRAELAAVEAAIARGVAAQPAIALVEGEPGVGKTRLLHEALARARALGSTTLYGAADEMGRTRPLGAVADALEPALASLDPERRRLARLIGGDVTAGAPSGDFRADLRHELVGGVVALIERLAAERPVTLALDDLHWADHSSLLVVRSLGRRAGEFRMALICSLRSRPRSRELESVVAELVDRGGERIRVGPLSEDEVSELVEAVVGAPPGASLREQLGGAAGNPLFLVELLKGVRREGLLTVAGGTAELEQATLPQDLRVTLLSRLADLSPPTVQILRLAAVLGTSFEVNDLMLMTRRSVIELLPSLEEALEASLLEQFGRERLAFCHGLLRKAIYEAMAPSVRAALHLEAGRALAASGAPALKVAGHLELGATRGDAQATKWLRRAAREAFGREPSIALELLRRAVELTPPNDPDRPGDVVELMYALMWAGRSDEALAVGQDTLADAALDPPVEADLRVALTWAFLLVARPDQARAQVSIALEQPEPPARGRHMLKAAEAFARLYVGEAERAVAAASHALAEADRVGDALVSCQALHLQALAARLAGRTTEAIALARDAIERANRSGSGQAMRWPSRLVLGAALIDADRFIDAEAELRLGERRSTDFGGGWYMPIYRWRLAQLWFVTGQWNRAIEAIEAGLSLADEHGIRIVRTEALGHRALIAVHRNDLATASDALDRASGGRARESWPGAEMLWARALTQEARGDAVRARSTLDEAWPVIGRVAPCSRSLVGPDYVRLLVQEGRMEEAAAVAADVERTAATMGAASARAAALLCRGLASSDAEPLLAAVALLSDVGRPPALAEAAELAGSTLVREARLEEGRALLERAHDLYSELGAMRGSAATAAALRGLGVRYGRRGRRSPRSKQGLESLTPSERAVVDLVGAGLTNREIARRLVVSPRTIETHVSHAFRKLGVGSRAELWSLVRSGPKQPPEGEAPAADP